MRVGYGYDAHRLVEGRPLILGGEPIPHEKGLAGHSDADVLLHAIGDAILGAAALGDLGSHFPDTDEEWAGADSQRLLRHVVGTVQSQNYAVQNVDSTVILERPKLRPHIDQIRQNVADCLDVTINHVSVKATTNEGMGAIGAGEGAVAHAVCVLRAA
ncbi:MAG: 2-C-methyl-D-erythritol 2,4-cyclodiphosphate synthase [Bacteroidetes bacterium QH_7_62_13]|nr:MAG: 2-C-methyl-D-erythritol 2,4-cyclodiphosphate synthase [Bacteroidetes bacterium QH_7_62_13]